MINNGDPVEASVVNSAFVSRVANTTVLSVLSLDAAASGNFVSNLQLSINKIYDTIGTSENDNYSKNYGGAPILIDGSSYKQSLITLANSTANNAAQIANLNTFVSNLQDTVTSLQSTVTSLQDTVTSLQSTVTSLQGTVTSLQGTVTSLQGTVTSLQSTVTILQNDVDLIKGQPFTFQGNKTFQNNVTINGQLTVDGASSSLMVNSDSTFYGNINQGASNNASFGNLSSKNKQLLINEGGSSSGQNDAGLVLKGPSSASDGFFKTDATGEKWILKAPNKDGVIEFNLPASGVVTLPSESGPNPSALDFYIAPEERTLGEAINAGVFVMRYGGDYAGESRKKLYKLPFGSQVNNASLVLVFVTTAKAADEVLDESECCLIGTVTLPSSIFSASDKLLWVDTSNGSLTTTPPSSIVIEAGWVLDADKIIFKPTFICY